MRGDSRAVVTASSGTSPNGARSKNSCGSRKARSRRPARRRRRARLQQHPDEHHGAADLLMMQLGADDPARGEASEIKQSVERGAGVTRQLLAFSRRQATRSRLFALGDILRALETMLSQADRARDRVRNRNGARPVIVMADSGQFEQVVMNLVINARDAMPDGGRLSVRSRNWTWTRLRPSR